MSPQVQEILERLFERNREILLKELVRINRELVREEVLKQHQARSEERKGWYNTRETAAKIAAATKKRCSAYTVRTKLVDNGKNNGPLKAKRIGIVAGGWGAILISHESIEAFILSESVPTKDFGDVPPKIVAARKKGNEQAKITREENKRKKSGENPA